MSTITHRTPLFTVKEGRRFGLLVGGMLVALAVLLLWRERSVWFVATVGGVGALLALAGAALPARLGPVYRAWMGLARVLSKVTTPVFMAIIYFLVITPVAVVRRTLGGNPLVTRRGSDGYWVVREPGKHGSMERQF